MGTSRFLDCSPGLVGRADRNHYTLITMNKDVGQYDMRDGMKTVFFDIETGPLPEQELDDFEPVFDPPRNIKDPEKIRAALAKKSSEWRERAALSPLTGEVLAIGMRVGGENTLLLGDEKDVLTSFWNAWEKIKPAWWVGHNVLSFDLPFIVRRCWRHDIAIPYLARTGKGRFDDCFVDTMQLWGCGVFGPEGRVSLDNFAKHLGIGAKNGSGANFARLLKEDDAAALEYLEKDLELTEQVFDRIERRVAA